MQQKADILGTSLFTDPQNIESVLHGVAILAGVGAGIYRDVNEAYSALDRELMEYAPDMEMHALYNKRYELFSQIYPSLRALHKSMTLGGNNE